LLSLGGSVAVYFKHSIVSLVSFSTNVASQHHIQPQECTLGKKCGSTFLSFNWNSVSFGQYGVTYLIHPFQSMVMRLKQSAIQAEIGNRVTDDAIPGRQIFIYSTSNDAENLIE